jgi:hypothetical protein
MTIEEYVVSELTRLSDRVKKADEVIREQERENEELKEQLESSKKYAEKRQMASAKRFAELEEVKAGLNALDIGFIHDDSVMVFSSVITKDNPGFKALHDAGKEKEKNE